VSEIKKRIITSIILLVILYFSIIYKFVLIPVLLLLFYEILYEANNLIKKIKNIQNFKRFFLISLVLFYLSFFFTTIWNTIAYGTNVEKINFLLILSTCILSDIGGFLFGKLFKGKKLTKISPNKTYSGLIGAFVLSIFINFLIFSNFILFYKILFYTILISSISQIGDITISYLKRRAKIKDTGNFLPGHGGIIDRLDGLFFALPFGLFLFNLA
tara:strand:+ start:539 stop:1183 length:645 start_codon:yes stop_codon:yes gene_type:complete